MKTLLVRALLVHLWVMASTAAVGAEALPRVPIERLDGPGPGKAAVYFFLPGKTPAIPSIALFDQDVQLPNLLGAREYVRYEFEPGLHTFTVQPLVPGLPESGQWVHGDLEEGGIYAALISTFMADLVIRPLTGRMDPDLLVNMKIEGEQWARVVGLIEAKPPKPPGKERKHSAGLDYIAGYERLQPTAAFSNLVRLNPTSAHPEKLAIERLPDPAPDRSVVVFFVPPKRPDQIVTLFDGQHKLGPDLKGGAYYTYETEPGPTNIWVGEVQASYTRYRVVTGDLEPGRVYAIAVAHSLGHGGARLFSLSGNADNRISFIPEPELWSEIEGLWGSEGGALRRVEPVDAEEMKAITKKLKKKVKKRRSGFTPLR